MLFYGIIWSEINPEVNTMEETLGKRIAGHRKRLGMTQDRLAEQLGVTAQAVSKWENDQSCPDIAMLPKLAELFGISVDALLGVASHTQAAEAEVVEPITEEEAEPDGLHFQSGNVEFHWDGGRRSSLALAVWILIVGGLLLAGNILTWNLELWDVLWTSGLLVFGLFGILSKFSIFSLSCMLFGAYFLLNKLHILPISIGKELLLPVLLLLFGLSLLIDALHKPSKRHFTLLRNGQKIRHSRCEVADGMLDCNLAFCEVSTVVDAPRLRGGNVSVSFGELELDFSGCEEIAPGCTIEADCSFGELTIKVPRRYRIDADTSTSFGNYEVSGSPDAEPVAVINLVASASFGEISIKYI